MKNEMYLKNEVLKSQPGGDEGNSSGDDGNSSGEGG